MVGSHWQQVCLGVVALSLVAQVKAQVDSVETDTGRRELEEVVVTAQKVTENLQNVPISVSVATAKDIADVNAFDFGELVQLTPGVSLFPGITSAAIQVRGVGPDFYTVGNPQSVTIFVDQFAQSQVGAVFSTLVDVERLELLRGPQGTLYGQNSPGGAYNITTASPNFDGFNGYLQYSYSQFDARDLYTNDVRAALNVPLVDDKLAMRIAAVYSDSEGFIRMPNPASEDKTTGGKDNRSLRAKLLWQINDVMDLQFSYNRQDLWENILSKNYQGVVPGSGGAIPAVYNKFKDRRDYGSFAGVATGDVEDYGAHFRWDAGVLNFDFLAFHQEFDTQNGENRAAFFGGDETFNIFADYKITTLEARVSNEGDIFDYVAGLYYYDRPFQSRLDLVITGVLVQGGGSADSSGGAAYANFNFHLAPKWDLSLGARYDDNTSSLDSDITFLTFNPKVKDDLSDSHVSWSVKLRNYINDNMTAYLAIDHAYKQGGFNYLTAGALEVPGFPDIAAVAETLLTYDEETSDAIELGFKSTFFDNSLRVNADIFYQRFNDHQVPQPGQVDALAPFGALFEQNIANAEEVTTKGVEFDIAWLFADYWDMGLRGSYADAIGDEWSTRFCKGGEVPADSGQLYCPLDGDPLGDNPRWNTNFQLGMDRPLRGAWSIYSRFNWTWQSKPAKTEVTDEFADPKSLFGLTLGVRENNIGLDIRAWGKNLTNTDLNNNPELETRTASIVPGQPAPYSGSYNPGREYGITVRYDF